MTDADELLRRLVLKRYQANDVRPDWPVGDPPHLATCLDAEVIDFDSYDGEYGCDTGCEYARLEATIRCAHGYSVDVQYGDFGFISDLVADMARQV